MQWNDEPFAAVVLGCLAQFAQLSGSQWFPVSGSSWFSVVRRPGFWTHAGTPIGSWPVRKRGGLRGASGEALFAALVLGKLRFAFGTYPRPSRVSGCVEFASLTITAAPSRYLSLTECCGAFEEQPWRSNFLLARAIWFPPSEI